MSDTKEIDCDVCHLRMTVPLGMQIVPYHHSDIRLGLVCNQTGKNLDTAFVKPEESEMKDSVNHPAHYQAKNDPNGTYEAIKVIEAWELGFCLGNTVKYISRAGKKDPAKTIEDLKKSAWYLNREIERLEKGQ